MMDNTTNHEATAEQPSLEQLLRDAFDAPPPPASLLKRVERGIELQWGVSPRITPARRLLSMRRPRWASATAAVVLAATVLAILLSVNTSSYAWADVLASLSRRGVVQIDGPNGVRWLALSECQLGQRTGNVSILLDVRRKVLLQRDLGQQRVRSHNIRHALSARSTDQLLVTFLKDESLQLPQLNRLAGLRIVDEQWQRRRQSGREDILLDVRFETSGGERFTLRLTLDPETSLPRSCEQFAVNAESHAFNLSYPSVAAAELREQHFPPELAVVYFDHPPDASAADTDVAAADQVADEQIAGQANVQEGAQVTMATAAQSAATGLLGDPSQWQPVAVVDLSRDEVRRRLDGLLVQLWEEKQIEPAEPADDEELLRRVYLDLAGRTPSVTEARLYLDDTSADRYERLVERLLQSPDHASHVATVWRTFLIPEGVDLTAFGGIEEFDRWLARHIADNQPYDEVVRSLLLAEGRLSRSGPLLFYSAVKLDPDQLAARTARVFLGMRLECAQCHDHPFEPWSQQDFWSFAAFFAQISRPQAEFETVSTVMRVSDVDRGEVMLPDTETVVAPRFLDGADTIDDSTELARRKQLAHWLTSRENPYFARATANRVWGHMFGRGIVDPVDDFGQQHPPASPELLDLLAGYFINTDFDLRELFHTIALSHAYRLSSGAQAADQRRTQWFAQMPIKMLTAEQMYDCITVATMVEQNNPGGQVEFQMTRFGNADRAAFLEQFRTLAGRTTEYQGGIPQALTLMNGGLVSTATGLSSSGLLASLQAPFFTSEQRIEVLYLATLSRRPRPEEWQLLQEFIPAGASAEESQESLADLLWALLNSAEFTMNH